MNEQNAIDRINALTEAQRNEGIHSVRMGIRPLKASERIAAQEHARKITAGKRPSVKSINASLQDAPPVVDNYAVGLTIVALIAAFVLSAFHIWNATIRIAQSHANGFLLYVIGFSSILLAEFAQVAFTLMQARTKDETSKRILLGLAFGAMVWALLGNIVAAQPSAYFENADNFIAWVVINGENLFVWCSALLPPIFVMGLSFALKVRVLTAIMQSYAAQHAHTNALERWQSTFDNAEIAPLWVKNYSDALREAIQKANARSERGRNALAQLDDKQWFALVERERNAGDWYTTQNDLHVQETTALLESVNATPVQEDETAEAKPVRVRRKRNATQDKRVAAAGKRTHELDGTVMQNGETFTATCPQCNEVYSGYDTHRKAILALVAHTRHAHRTAKVNVQ